MDSALEEIKSRIDIVDFLSEYINLKKTGQNYKGLCPFHSEKTPSFIVSPSKQIFHCFGCNKGGDIFTFIMMHENMTFQEALSYLAERANVPLHKSKKEGIRGEKDVLFSMYKESALFFQENLKASRNALNYLKERKINDESIERFVLGYSLREKDSLFNFLKKKGFSLEDIKRSGLINFSRSEVYDFFRDRLIFPISDIQGRIVAFGGRTISGQKNIPKYINSQESPIFKKGELSYGLNLAKNSITEKGYSIIVEGYLDVIMCHQYGIKNVIAPLGTALTSGQLRKIKRFSNNVLLIFDGDNAGISAAKRAIQLCYGESFTTKILLLPSGEDPDSFLRKYGDEEFRRFFSKSLTPVEFLLKTAGNRRLDVVRDVIRLISICPDPLRKEEEIKELSEKTRISELTIREEIKNASKNYKRDIVVKDVQRDSENKDKDELMLLGIAISVPEKIESILERLDLSSINNSLVKGIFEKIRNVYEKKEALSFDKILSLCEEDEKRLIIKLSLCSDIDRESIDKMIKDCIKTIGLKKLETQIKQASEVEDLELLNRLLSEKRKMMEGQ